VSFAAITLCVATQRVFIIVVVYFVIDSVRRLLDTPSYSAELSPCPQSVGCSCTDVYNIKMDLKALVYTSFIRDGE
jgi:hypothetical protein